MAAVILSVMHSIEAALSDDASFPDGKIEPGFLDRYANRIVKSNNRYIWMLQLVNVQQIMPIQSERQPIAMVTYKSGVPYDIEQEQTGKQDKESAGLRDNMSSTGFLFEHEPNQKKA